MILKELTYAIRGAAIEVHRCLGPGLLESAYEHCLCYELMNRGINFERQVKLPITYHGQRLDAGYRLDLVVEKCIILELKAVQQFHPVHEAQLISYLKLYGAPVGLLINFHVVRMIDGIKRYVNS